MHFSRRFRISVQYRLKSITSRIFYSTQHCLTWWIESSYVFAICYYDNFQTIGDLDHRDFLKFGGNFRNLWYMKFCFDQDHQFNVYTQIGQLSANQTFLLLNTSFDLALECDGLLSLAYSTTDSEEKMSVENLLEQFDEKVVSIWLDDRSEQLTPILISKIFIRINPKNFYETYVTWISSGREARKSQKFFFKWQIIKKCF